MTTRDTNPFIRVSPDNPFRPPCPGGDHVHWAKGDKAPEDPTTTAALQEVDMAGLSPMAMQPKDRLDLLLKEAREVKADIKALEERYSDLRLSIWEAAGHKIGKLPGGAAFRKLTSRRSVKYKDLKADHPEIYRKYVTETDPDPDAPGALYL